MRSNTSSFSTCWTPRMMSLTDAETGRRVDVLEGRTADVVEDWLKAYPGAGIVCRDGSGAYGEAVKSALPGAVQCGDRWHLWHLLGEAAAKEVAAHSACWAEAAPLQQGKRAETTLERWRQVHDLRSRGAGLLDCSRRLGLSLNTVKRYDRASEPERLQRVPKYRPTLVDPYRDYLRRRREEEPGVPVQQLLREIRERGYPGSSNLLVRYINQGRLDTERPHIAPRKATQILLTNPENLPGDQRETAGRLSAACPEMKALARLIGKFAAMLDPDPANEDRLLEWIADARAAGLPHLHSFTRGLELDIKAATAAVTLPYHNGRTEGVNNIKTKNAETADVRARRLRTPPSPDPSRVRRRSVTTESATEPILSVVFVGGSQCGAVSRAGTPGEGLARGVMRPRACAFIILRSYCESRSVPTLRCSGGSSSSSRG